MNDERTAMLAAICADPADDTPRLVFADWLDEHGEPERAEFIRVQCEYNHMPAYPGERYCESANGLLDVRAEDCRGSDCRPCYLRRRGRELIEANAHKWLFDIPPGMRPILPDSILDTFSRGFVSQVTCTAADWLAHADALAWRPGWKMDCPDCRGIMFGAVGLGGYTHGARCQRCNKDGHGTGRVPRRCPPTAQPIERVTLTTFGAEFEMYEATTFADGSARKSVCPRWPGITFVLPDGGPGNPVRIGTDDR